MATRGVTMSSGNSGASGSSTGIRLGQAWAQSTVRLQPRGRGCHVVTREVVDALPELSRFRVGLAHIHLMHTSASLTLNENASPDVPKDLADALDGLVPDGRVPGPQGVPYRHLDEGPDDMSAHVKGSLMGFSLTIPISDGKLCLGTWQGIYLNEHRNSGGPRTVTVTLTGAQ